MSDDSTQEWCAHEDKKCYSKIDAQRIINLCSAKHHKQRQKHIPKRFYYCEYCQQYHLTHIINEYSTPNKDRKLKHKKFTADKRKVKQQLNQYKLSE